MTQMLKYKDLRPTWHEAEHGRLVEYLQHELNKVTNEKYSDEHTALAYQLGFLQSCLATAIMRDSDVITQFKTAIANNRKKTSK